MNEPRRTLCSEIPYRVEVEYHAEFGEYEAYIPALGRYLFTAAGETRSEAVEELQALYPDLLKWFVKNHDGPIPRPDIGRPSEVCEEAQPEMAGLLHF